MPKQKQEETPQVQSTLTLREDILPQIKDWKVGETYDIQLTVKQVGADQSPDAEGDVPSTARFTIVSAKAMGSGGGSDQTDQSGDMGDMMDGSQNQDMMNQGSPRQKVMSRMKQKSQQY